MNHETELRRKHIADLEAELARLEKKTWRDYVLTFLHWFLVVAFAASAVGEFLNGSDAVGAALLGVIHVMFRVRDLEMGR